MTLHTDRPNRIMSLPTVQIGTELAVLLADYLGDQEKNQGYNGLMRRAADHLIYHLVSRWRTAPDPEATAVAVDLCWTTNCRSTTSRGRAASCQLGWAVSFRRFINRRYGTSMPQGGLPPHLTCLVL